MRFSSLAAVAVATAPLLVSATGQLGFALGVRKSNGQCKESSDFESDFKTLSQYTKIVRTYSAVDKAIEPTCYVPSAILPAAAKYGIKVILGLWPDTIQSFNDDKAEVLKVAPDYQDTIAAFTIGSETLYRHQHDQSTGLTTEDLIDRIKTFRSEANAKGLKQDVGTADSWNKFQKEDGAADAVIPYLDIVLVNAFGYWQSQDISNASATYLDDLQQAIGHIQSISKSTTKPKIWNGETGWPTDGGADYHDPATTTTAVAGTKNAQYFYTNGVCAALDWDFNVFYFEAFAEPWKPDSKGVSGDYRDEKHWGAFDASGVPILDLSCKYKEL